MHSGLHITIEADDAVNTALLSHMHLPPTSFSRHALVSAYHNALLSEPSNTNLSAEEPNTDWSPILVLASETAYSDTQVQTRLINLLQDLHNLPSDLQTAYENQHPVINGKPVDGSPWRNLPCFSMQCREALNYDTIVENDSETAGTWINLHAFFARCTVSSLDETEMGRDDGGDGDERLRLTFELFALWMLRAAFEGTGEVRKPDWDAAAVWIVVAGSLIREWCEAGRDMCGQGRSGIAGKKYREKGWRGFEMERWEVWKNEFEELSRGVGLDDESKTLVRRALEVMR